MEQTKDSIVSVRGKEEGIQPRDINAQSFIHSASLMFSYTTQLSEVGCLFSWPQSLAQTEKLCKSDFYSPFVLHNL